MSVHSLVAVKDWIIGAGREHSPTARLVALAIADHLNKRGEAWPSQRRLAELVGCSERRVRSALRVVAREVFTVHRRGRGLTSIYRLRPDTIVRSRADTGVRSQGAQERTLASSETGHLDPPRPDTGVRSLKDNLPTELAHRTKRAPRRKFSERVCADSRWAEGAWIDAHGRKPSWSRGERVVLLGAADRAGASFRSRWTRYLADSGVLYRGHSPKKFDNDIERWAVDSDDGRRRPSAAAGTRYPVEKVSI